MALESPLTLSAHILGPMDSLDCPVIISNQFSILRIIVLCRLGFEEVGLFKIEA
jgi:hypothetical protein